LKQTIYPYIHHQYVYIHVHIYTYIYIIYAYIGKMNVSTPRQHNNTVDKFDILSENDKTFDALDTLSPVEERLARIKRRIELKAKGKSPMYIGIYIIYQ
jgi:hypothetical protein